jgi:hypothetical protein
LPGLASAPQHGGRSAPKQAVQLAEVSADGSSGGRWQEKKTAAELLRLAGG